MTELDLMQNETENLQTELRTTVFYDEDFVRPSLKKFWKQEFTNMSNIYTRCETGCVRLKEDAEHMLSYMSDFSSSCLVKSDIKDLLQRVVRHIKFQLKAITPKKYTEDEMKSLSDEIDDILEHNYLEVDYND